MSFEKEDFLKTKLPSTASSMESQNRLKSPPRIINLFIIFDMKKPALFRCLGNTQITVSNIIKEPFLSFFFFKSLKDLFPVY